jgi:antitoxin HicB
VRYAYPYVVKREPEGGFFISFPDVPEALTGAAATDDVGPMAEDALMAALSFYAEADRPLPAPSAARGRPVARVPVVVALKLALHEAMLSRGTTNVALAAMLNTDEKSIRRMRDLMQPTKVEKLEAALHALGRRAEVIVLEPAA